MAKKRDEQDLTTKLTQALAALAAEQAKTLKENNSLMAKMEAISQKVGVNFDRNNKSLSLTTKAIDKTKKLTDNIKTTEQKLMSTIKDKAELEIKIEARKSKGATKKQKDDLAANQIEVDNLMKQLEMETDLLEIEEGKIAQSKALDSVSQKFFGNVLGNLEKSDFAKGFGIDKFIGKLGHAKIAINFLITLGMKAFNAFNDLDNALFNLRKNFGLMRGDNVQIEKTVKSIGLQYQQLGITFDDVANSVTEIGSEFGLLSSYSEDIITNVSTFSKQLGVSEKTSASFLKTLSTISGKTLTQASQGAMGFAQSLNAAAGTNINEVMGDIASMSESTRATFRGNTVELIKSTVEARRLGMSLDSMARTSEGLLDFNTSVNAEMEASVLLGRNINLMEARRKAFAGDLIGANKEILRVVKSVGDLESLNMMQRKALAAATGKSLEELQTMVQREKEIEWIRSKGSPELKAQLDKYEAMQKVRESEAKDIGKMAEERIRRENHQTRMAALQAQFNALMMKMAEPLMDIVEPLMELATKILPPIIKHITLIGTLFGPLPTSISLIVTLFRKVSTFFPSIGSTLKTISASIGKVVSFFGKWIPMIGKVSTSIGKVVSFFGKVSTSIGKWIPIIGKVVSLFGKWIPYIGWVITAVQFIGSLMKRWEETPKGILGGLQAIGGALYDVLIKPFVDFLDWFGLNISELGLGIVRGIKAVGSMLIDVLISPFKFAYNIITKLFTNITDFIVGGIKAIGSMLIDVLLSPFKFAYNIITKLFTNITDFIVGAFKKGIDFAMKLPGVGLLIKTVNLLTGGQLGTKSTNTEQLANQKQIDSNKEIINKLDELITLMKSGAIAVNIDGRKASELLAYASR